ncbi:MAG: YggS family pyridoxal phosphate-dependent enzyme [Clostridia bacterium]|nr:YggS family pyridoxal phosphate-dependent enzyme [Clostridia bacterium]
MMTENEKSLIKENIEKIRSAATVALNKSGRNESDLRIVLATKTQSAEKINYAAQCGITEIGENRVQELLEKYDNLDKDRLNIHFIGTLQTNKVKYIIDKVCLIHSVNSIKLADEINRQALKHGIVKDILIELNAAGESSKTGIDEDGLYELLYHASTLKNVKVKGLMAIPPAPKINEFSACETSKLPENVNKLQINADSRQYFKKIYQIFLDISAKKIDNISMEILSLGMSADFVEAIEEGSNLIRPGKAVFGDRIY